MLLSVDKAPTGSCLSRSCFKISNWVSITYSLGVFQAVIFCDESKEDWIFIWAHLEWDLHYLQFYDSPSLNLHWFSNQALWELVFLVPAPRVKEPYMRNNPSHLCLAIPPNCGVVWCPGWGHVSPFLPFPGCLLCFLLWECCSRVLFREKLFHM